MNRQLFADALRALASAIEADETAPQRDPAQLLSVKEAAGLAATSVGVVREAIRVGDLIAYGGQRDRSVRRADLDAWILARRFAPIAGVADADIERRMERLAKAAKDSAEDPNAPIPWPPPGSRKKRRPTP